VSAGVNTPAAADAAVMLPRIESRILVVREHKVIVDADLALLYGVPTKALNQAVKRNAERFPMDFMFQLSAAEKAEVVTSCDHLQKLKFSKSLPFAFTEHGAIQAANVLASPRAVEMGVYVVRTLRAAEAGQRFVHRAGQAAGRTRRQDRRPGAQPRHLQPQHAYSAQAGLWRPARTHDTA
jgi:hypothetical protein